MKQFNITVTANGETAFDGLATPGMTFGRRPTNDCTIPERSVSGTHARLVAVGGELHIEDLGSGNKTRIQNGVTLGEGEQAMLVHGMVIAMGRARVEVSIVGKDAEDPEQTLLQTDDLAPPAPPRSEPKQQNPPTQELPLPALRTVKSPIYDSESIETKVGPEPVISAARESGISTKPTDRGQGMAASEPAPSVPSGSSVRTIGYQTGHSEEVAEKTSAAGLELLRSMRPRLVFDDDAMREIVSIDTVEIMIGRSRKGDIRVDHEGISSRHCRMRFDQRSKNFIVEDLGSSNGMEIGGQPLLPHQPAVLQPESHLKFGPVGALFVVDRDARGVELPEARFDLTLKILIASAMSAKIVTAIKQAANEPGVQEHVGERLILSGAVTAWEWSRAWEKARTFSVTPARTPGAWVPWAIGALVVVVLAGLAYWVKNG